MANKFNLPNLGLGVGLRTQHYDYLLKHKAEVDWFEIISENYIDNFGFSRYVLEHICKQKPVVMHGVSMSIGSTDELNLAYLQKLKDLATLVQPAWISDHLCWTGANGLNTHDLLPMPLTEESLRHTVERVLRVQDFLKRPLILENPSTYLEFTTSTMHEWEFLSELTRLTDCGLLLDVNNVYVSATNHGYEAETYIQNVPHERIVQIHIAGPSDCGGYFVDTHDQPVPSRVWELYRLAQELTGGVATLLEWDANIPAFPELVQELHKAKQALLGEFAGFPALPTATESPISNPSHLHTAYAN